MGPVWYGLLFQWSRLAEPVWDGRQARSAQISRKKTHAQRERERDGELHPLYKMGNKIVAVLCKIPRLDLPRFKDIPNLSAL